MASFPNISELVTGDAVQATTRPPPVRTGPTISPGHAAILEMHENSQTNALIYIAVVLGLYIFGISMVIIKYVRSERYEARLGRLFQDLVQRDTFFRLSRRHSNTPKPAPTPDQAHPEGIELPTLSPTGQIPEIQVVEHDHQSESKV